MDRQGVASKAIRSMGYDEAGQVLEIEFRNGRVYQYTAVPPSMFEWLLRTSDKGGVFNRLIRDRFAERDVTPVPDVQDLEALLRASLDRDGEQEK